MFYTPRRLSTFLIALLGACLAAACGDSPAAPTPGGAPKLTCPAPQSQVASLGAPISVIYPLPTVTGGLAPLVGPTCTPPTGSNFPPGVNTVACTITDSQGRSDLCTFTVTVTLPPRLSLTRFLAFGDSMTWGEDGRNVPSDPTNVRISQILPRLQVDTPNQYPFVLLAELQARYTFQASVLSMRSDGHPGLPITDPNTFAFFTQDLAASTYDVALLLDGANDLGAANSAQVASGNPADATRVEGQAIAGLGRLIDYATAAHVRVFLATLPPENPSGCCPSPRGGAAALVPEFNGLLRSLATSRGIPLVDLYQAFNGDLTLISPDGLHPNIKGYHLIADTFFASIRQTLEIGSATTTSTVSAPVRPAAAARRR